MKKQKRLMGIERENIGSVNVNASQIIVMLYNVNFALPDFMNSKLKIKMQSSIMFPMSPHSNCPSIQMLCALLYILSL